MMNKSAPPKDVNEYLLNQPENVRVVLEQLRQRIKAAAPQAEEVISYGMPAYKYKGMLVYFAGYNNHIGFYPTAKGIEAFKKELSEYEISKGTVRFPIDKKLPLNLIRKMVKFRMKENMAKEKLKK
jgi:uncharacterized protein YdhG (YjbR/CyaY superfamily)